MAIPTEASKMTNLNFFLNLICFIISNIHAIIILYIISYFLIYKTVKPITIEDKSLEKTLEAVANIPLVSNDADINAQMALMSGDEGVKQQLGVYEREGKREECILEKFYVYC